MGITDASRRGTQSEATGAAHDSLATQPGLFVRKSSGLVRELGIRDAFAVNAGGLNPAGTVGFGLFILLAGFPGTDLTWPLVVAAVGAFVLALTYSQLVAAMPRSGADYVYSSRAIHPSVGAAVGGAILLAILFGSGALWVYLFASTYLPFVFETFGSVFHSHALMTFSVTLAEKGWVLGVSLAVCLLTGWLMMQRTSLFARVTYYAVGGAVIACIVLILEFLFHSSHDFRHAFDAHLHNPAAYSQVIGAAHKLGVFTGVRFSAVFASIAVVNLVYQGFTYANYTGGELRKPGKTFRTAALACLGVSMALVLIAWLVIKHVVGLPFLQSAGWLANNEPTAYGKIAGDVTAYSPSYVLLIASNPVSKVVIAIGFAAGALSSVFAASVVMSRLLFALSFDRVLPTAVSQVRAKSHAPLAASVIVTALLVTGTVLIVYTNVLVTVRNLGLVFSGVLVISSLVAATLPWRRKDLYEQAPKVVGSRIGGVPAITIVGGLSAAYWAVYLYLGATKTQVSGGYSTTSVLTLAVTCSVGFVAYWVSRTAQRRKGVDLDLALRELPPE